MKHLIDNFPPGELLHIVSVANRHGLLSTDDKRYLIALRMAAPYGDKGYGIDDEKKNRFPGILGRFFAGLDTRPGYSDCGKQECLLCARFTMLRNDFSGPGLSREYALFSAWLHKAARAYEEPVAGSSFVNGACAGAVAESAGVPVTASLPEASATLSRYSYEPDEDDHARPEDISISQARIRMALMRREQKLARDRHPGEQKLIREQPAREQKPAKDTHAKDKPAKRTVVRVKVRRDPALDQGLRRHF